MAETVSPPAERLTSQALDDAERGSLAVSVVTKRLRYNNKRLTKITRMEEKARDQPDKLNADQVETLQSKTGVLAAKDELERLIPLLQEAEKEAVEVAVQRAVDKALAQERAQVAAQAPKQPEGISQEHRSQVEAETIDRLLPLLYFSQTFDFSRGGRLADLERSACLSYYNAHHQDRDEGPEADLTLNDLELMCKLGSLMLSRSSTECISHSASLQQAKSLAAQWLHPTAEPLSILDDNSTESVDRCLSRVMATGYITVQPVLSKSAPGAEVQNGSVHVPEDGQYPSETQQDVPSSHPHLQERPDTPDLRQQESHIFSDITHPTDSSTSQSPPQQDSGSAVHTRTNSHPQDSTHEGYPQAAAHQQTNGLHRFHQNDYMQQPGHLTASQALPNGQGYQTDAAPALNFMTNSSVTAGVPEGGTTHEAAVLANRPLQQQSVPSDLPESAFTNGPLPSEGINGIMGQSDSGPLPVQAALSGPQNSHGIRQRGDGGQRPERQGSYRGRGGNRARGYEGSNPGGRGFGRGSRRGRPDGFSGRSDRNPRGGFDHARGSDTSHDNRGAENAHYNTSRGMGNGYDSTKGVGNSYDARNGNSNGVGYNHARGSRSRYQNEQQSF